MDYDDDILRMKYWDVKDLKADRTSLLLDCSTGASRSLDMITLEKHRAKKVCPLHFLDVVVSHAQCKAMGRAWKSQFEGRGTRLLYLDDESYASDEAKPLPE